MPNLFEINAEIRTALRPCQSIREKYLNLLHQHSGRNTILYYSGWLHNPATRKGIDIASINELDKSNFMGMVAGWNREQRAKGLDLILHTPGGSMSATESIGNYLAKMFGGNIRIIVPQLAMSGGTMLACLGKSIVMGKHSGLGPTDPQFDNVSAYYAMVEFEQAAEEYPQKKHWQIMLDQYPPGFYTECKRSIQWSEEIIGNWLMNSMFANDARKRFKSAKIAKFLCDGSQTYVHERQLNAEECKRIGLRIDMLEDDPILQDAVLSLHHACMLTFADTSAIKIIENHSGASLVDNPD